MPKGSRNARDWRQNGFQERSDMESPGVCPACCRSLQPRPGHARRRPDARFTNDACRARWWRHMKMMREIALARDGNGDLEHDPALIDQLVIGLEGRVEKPRLVALAAAAGQAEAAA